MWQENFFGKQIKKDKIAKSSRREKTNEGGEGKKMRRTHKLLVSGHSEEKPHNL